MEKRRVKWKINMCLNNVSQTDEWNKQVINWTINMFDEHSNKLI